MTPAQIERLGLLAEEAAEVIQAVGKILRHGFSSYNPDDPEQRTNDVTLAMELGDMEYAINLLVTANDISVENVARGRELANRKKPQYLHYQIPRG
jgi:phosphoribosyl-ATP pyrophosphohydrolase